jgi:MFS family permease
MRRAGLAASIVAGAQIAGGLLVPHIRTAVRPSNVGAAGGDGAQRRYPGGYRVGAALLDGAGASDPLGMLFAALTPIRQAYINSLIASKERATVLSFDSLLGSSGAVGIQPILGKAADAWGYPASYTFSAVIQMLAIPFLWLARRERAASGAIVETSKIIRA